MDFQQRIGAKLRVGHAGAFRTLRGAQPTGDGWTLFLADDDRNADIVNLTAQSEASVEFLTADGSGDGHAVLAAMWNEWMAAATLNARATALGRV
ncbi:MAG: hypothetical protein M3O86_06355 [Actinomycetota bacterium]|nr:hypothetical protein [Actinomycetota bacterium]